MWCVMKSKVRIQDVFFMDPFFPDDEKFGTFGTCSSGMDVYGNAIVGKG